MQELVCSYQNSFDTCRLLEEPRSPITAVEAKPFINLPPKAG